MQRLRFLDLSRRGALGIAVLLVGCHFVACAADYVEKWTETRRWNAPEATQAAAADDRFVYAIGNTVVAKYDRATGERVSRSAGEAIHLNTGFFLDGQMYCAHSNFPHKPDRSDIKKDDAWWCNFAFYGSDNHKTYLAKFVDWREVGRWTYPPDLIKAFGTNSASCGVWRDGKLLLTGHDEREIFVLELPASGDILHHVATVPAPFTGQGFAADPVNGGLVGIDRPQRQIIFAQ